MLGIASLGWGEKLALELQIWRLGQNVKGDFGKSGIIA
jgi:hypothetical protein